MPAASAAAPAPAADPTAPAPPQRVLVVEDLADTRESLQTLLRLQLKLEVDVAEDGRPP